MKIKTNRLETKLNNIALSSNKTILTQFFNTEKLTDTTTIGKFKPASSDNRKLIRLD